MFRKPDTTKAKEAANKQGEAAEALTSLAPGNDYRIETAVSEPREEMVKGNGFVKLLRRITGKK